MDEKELVPYIDFKNKPDKTTPLNRTNINKMQTLIRKNINENYNEGTGKIGNLNKLNTKNKENLVLALNESLNLIGDLSKLNTINKNNIVESINEFLDEPDYNLNIFGVPIKTGRKVFDKDEYVEIINIENVPNNAQKKVPTGLETSNINITDLYAITSSDQNKQHFKTPIILTNEFITSFMSADGNFVIATNANYSYLTAIGYIYFTYNEES